MSFSKPAPWWPGCDILDPLCPDEAWPLWEGAGSSVNAVGKSAGDAEQYLGTRKGTGPHWAGSTRGGVAALNGTDDYIDLGPMAGQFATDKPFTVSCWVCRLGSGTQVSSHNAVLTTYINGSSGWMIFWSSIFDRYEFYLLGSSVAHVDTAINAAAAGVWGHLVVVYQGGASGNMSLYWNGVHIQTVASNGYDKSGRNCFVGGGWFARPATDFFDGLVDDIRFFAGQALTATQAMLLFNNSWEALTSTRSASQFVESIVTTYSVTRVGNFTTYIVSSVLAEPYFHWYVDGVYAGVTRDPRWELYLSDGEQAHVEVIDTVDVTFDPVAEAPAAYPSRRTLWWNRSLSTDVASYRVEQQQDGGSWTVIATVHVVADQWNYQVVTEPLVDLASYNWRLVPVDRAGNDGTAINWDGETVVRWPDAPEWVLAFDGGTDRVTISEG